MRRVVQKWCKLNLCWAKVFAPRPPQNIKINNITRDSQMSVGGKFRNAIRFKGFYHTISKMCMVHFWSEWKCYSTMVRSVVFSYIRFHRQFGVFFSKKYTFGSFLCIDFYTRFFSSLFIRCCFRLYEKSFALRTTDDFLWHPDNVVDLRMKMSTRGKNSEEKIRLQK